MSKNMISIEVHSVSALLEEVIRVALHQSNPSAMLKRVAAGIEAFEAEASMKDDRELAGVLRGQIAALAVEYREAEEGVYSSTLASANPTPAFVRTYTPEDYEDDYNGVQTIVRANEEKWSSVDENEEEQTTINVRESELLPPQTDTITPPAIDAVRCAAYSR
jgi:hypothetical protein